MDGYSKHTDQELIDWLKSDDRVAFAEIYERYKRLLFLNAYNKLHVYFSESFGEIPNLTLEKS